MNKIWFTAAVVVVLVGLVKGEAIKCHECVYVEGNGMKYGPEDCKDDPGKLNSVKTSDPCQGPVPFNGIVRVKSNSSQATVQQTSLGLKAKREASVKASGSKCGKITASGEVDDVKIELTARGALCIDMGDDCISELPGNWEVLLPPEFGDVTGPINNLDISFCVCDSDECNSGQMLGFSLTLLMFAVTYVLLIK